MGDSQIPYHSPRAISTVLSFIRQNQDKITDVFWNGDILDFPALSLKFHRDPATKLRLKQDVRIFEGYRDKVSSLVPKARQWFIYGNHEERWVTYVEDKADELAWLLDDRLSLEALLGLQDNKKWTIVKPYGEGVNWHGLFITHGTKVSAHSAYTARSEYLGNGTSGISGHTHRGGTHYHTDRSGPHAWFEGFCLCNTNSGEGPLPPGHTDVGVRNQQQGFLILEWVKDAHIKPWGEMWSVTPVAMVNQCFVWDGKLYKP